MRILSPSASQSNQLSQIVQQNQANQIVSKKGKLALCSGVLFMGFVQAIRSGHQLAISAEHRHLRQTDEQTTIHLPQVITLQPNASCPKGTERFDKNRERKIFRISSITLAATTIAGFLMFGLPLLRTRNLNNCQAVTSVLGAGIVLTSLSFFMVEVLAHLDSAKHEDGDCLQTRPPGGRYGR